MWSGSFADALRCGDPEPRIRDAISATGTGPTMASLAALVDRRLSAEDITMVLVRRSDA